MNNGLEKQFPKFTKNSLAGILRVVILIPVTFLITPYMISKMGNQMYGLWSLGTVVTSFASLGDLGLGVALVKFTAEFNAKEEFEEINALLNTTVTTFVILGLLIVAVISLFSGFLIDVILRIPVGLYGQAKFLIAGMCIVFFLNIVLGSFTYMLEGFQRMDLSNFIKIVSVLFQTLMTYIALQNNWGIAGLVLGNSLAVILTGFLSILCLKMIFGPLRINIRYFDFKILKFTLGYSLQVQLANFIALGFDPFIRSAISNISTLSFVSFYDVANRITSQIRAVVIAGLNPIMPASAQIAISDNKTELARFHNEIFAILIAFGTILYILPIGLISGFIQLWLGSNFNDVSLTFQILMIGWYFSMLSTPAFVIFRGYGKPIYTIFTQTILVVTNIVLGIILGTKFGYYGIIYSIVIALVVSSLYTIVQFYKFTNSKISFFPFRSTIIVILLGILTSYTSNLVFHNLLPQSYATLIITATLSVLFYVASLFFLRILNWNELSRYLLRIKKTK